MMKDTLINIGKIVAPHGVRGDVRVIPLTDFPERFKKLSKVLIDGAKTYEIERVNFHKQFVLLKFQGLDNKNDVEDLRNKYLQIHKKDVAPLPEGHYYHFDIIGLTVHTEQGECLGKVKEILETGSNDVYVVESEDKKQTLIPALKKVVQKIDVENGNMVVILQEEWD